MVQGSHIIRFHINKLYKSKASNVMNSRPLMVNPLIGKQNNFWNTASNEQVASKVKKAAETRKLRASQIRRDSWIEQLAIQPDCAITEEEIEQLATGIWSNETRRICRKYNLKRKQQ